MAPPVTPSPHRFITGKHRRITHTDNARQAEPSADRPDVDPDLRPKTSSGRQAPRFAPAKPKQAPHDEQTRPSLTHTLIAPTRSRDSVEDTGSNEDHDDTQDEEMNAIPTTEHEPTKRLFLTSKRLHENMDFPTPARPVFRHPETPASQMKAPPRFTVPSIQSPAQVDASQRPAFLRSSTAPSAEPLEPLPDAFSPHRRGQKYLPGGMASTVQQWVLETAQDASQTRRAQAYLQGEDFALKVHVEDMSGDGPWLARGQTSDGEEKSLLVLRPDGDKTGELKVGVILGVRVPTWGIDIYGRHWTIAVDWTIETAF